MDHTCHFRVFSSVTRLLVLLERTAEAPHRQVVSTPDPPRAPRRKSRKKREGGSGKYGRGHADPCLECRRS